MDRLLSVAVLKVEHSSLTLLVFHSILFSVMVSFDPTSYTVTEGDDDFAVLTLVRSGAINRETVVIVNTVPGSAEGMVPSLSGSV